MQGHGASTLKWLMWGFNSLFFFSGIGMIVAGALALTVYNKYFNFLGSGFESAPALVIAVGVIITVVSFFGCCGAIRESFCMLMTFSVLLGIIFVLGLSGGIAVYVERNEIEGYLGKEMRQSMNDYYNSTEQRNALWDNTQLSYKCCGVDEYQDWFETHAKIVPDSCCKSAGCSRNETALAPCGMANQTVLVACPIYTQGCVARLSNDIEGHMAEVGGAGIAIAVLQLLGIVISCFLAKRIRSGYTYA